MPAIIITAALGALGVLAVAGLGIVALAGVAMGIHDDIHGSGDR